jgi:E3 ubiquitin-protein ligase RAD18
MTSLCASADSAHARTKNTFPNPLQRRQKDPSPPPTRLSQLNYAMLKEGSLRKKLQEIGIPTWGTKDLLKRRHIEWLNIYNSNCDAHESVRKSKRQLVKELEEWEHTQGGRADSRESRIMKKDFDGTGHAKSHKTEFDDLIAKARAKRGAPEEEQSGAPEVGAAGSQPPTVSSTERQQDPAHTPHNGSELGRSSHPPNPLHPYENNESALSTIRAKVAAANETGSTMSTLPSEPSLPDEPPSEKIGMRNPLGSPARQVPMFALPEQPVRDTDGAGAAH